MTRFDKDGKRIIDPAPVEPEPEPEPEAEPKQPK